MIVFFRGCVNRSDIKNFLLMSVGKSLIGEGKTAQNDEENSTPNVRFHVVPKAAAIPTAAGLESG